MWVPTLTCLLADGTVTAGETLTLWSVRLAVGCYLVRVLLDVVSRSDAEPAAASYLVRFLWTIGAVFCLVHIAGAFGVYHDWRHDAALRHTAEQTERMIGVAWAGGLYVNYAFTVLWLADVAAWWIGGVGFPYRHRVYFWTVHASFAFVVVNATVVFGPPGWRYVAAMFALCLAACMAFRLRGRPGPPNRS
ncbi:hypothetical protein [Roseimaritima sediminicola]|uniref:hypothetical protein n=1 Tax=Roseimaritima sediminicola TaxID=2662066 RepID=UPI001298342C|nr:hypothetical protein [Roseimaritima sediminicola]